MVNMRSLFRIIPIIAVLKVIILVLWLGFNHNASEVTKAYAEPSKTAADKTQKGEKVKKGEKKHDEVENEAVTAFTKPDVHVNASDLLAAIEKRQKELDKKEEEIKAQEEGLKVLKADVEARINELNKIKAEAEKTIKTIEAKNKEEFTHIIKIYEAMPAEEAAARISKLDNEMAIKLLSNMKGKTAGKILSFIEPTKAAELTEGLGKFKKGQ